MLLLFPLRREPPALLTHSISFPRGACRRTRGRGWERAAVLNRPSLPSLQDPWPHGDRRPVGRHVQGCILTARVGAAGVENARGPEAAGRGQCPSESRGGGGLRGQAGKSVPGAGTDCAGWPARRDRPPASRRQGGEARRGGWIRRARGGRPPGGDPHEVGGQGAGERGWREAPRPRRSSLPAARLAREGMLRAGSAFHNSPWLQEYSFRGNVSARIAIKLYDT